MWGRSLGKQLNLHANPFVLNILMISWCTHDIPHIYHGIPRCTKHTPVYSGISRCTERYPPVYCTVSFFSVISKPWFCSHLTLSFNKKYMEYCTFVIVMTDIRVNPKFEKHIIKCKPKRSHFLGLQCTLGTSTGTSINRNRSHKTDSSWFSVLNLRQYPPKTQKKSTFFKNRCD